MTVTCHDQQVFPYNMECEQVTVCPCVIKLIVIKHLFADMFVLIFATDPGLWPRAHCWCSIYDDSLCRDSVL